MERKEVRLEATIENAEKAVNFLAEQLETVGCDPKENRKIQLAVEELLVNVASYAYPDGGGYVTLGVSPEDPAVTIEIWDSGIPYDPLKKADPDKNIPLRERKIGGWGIYLAKRLMDEISYEYVDGKNHVTMRKYWNTEKVER